MFFKRFLFILVVVLFVRMPLIAQEQVQELPGETASPEAAASSPADSESDITFDAAVVPQEPSASENDGRKHYLAALTGAAFIYGGLFTYNRYVLGSGWTKVNWEYASHFYEHEQKWDTDWYWTNFVLHPYQGSLAYMAGRSANLNRLESFALATVCDFSWEYFCETNAPSKNDLVYSSIGAFAVGEMLHRLSLEADQIHWLLGYAINPERLWTEAWTRQKLSGTTGNIYELSLSTAVGTCFARSAFGYGYGTQYETFPAFLSEKISVVYNDPYGHDSNDPYSQFNLDIAGSIGVASGDGYSSIDRCLFHDVRIISDGMLFARAPQLGSGDTQTTVGMVFEYDFIWSNLVQLSSLAPGVAFKQRIELDASDIEWQLHGAWVALGTTEFDYFYRGLMSDISSDYREYSYTTGAELVSRFRWKTLAGQALSLDFHGYAMYDFYGQKQDALDTGWEFVGLLTAGYELPVSKLVRLGLQNELYVKKTLFNEMENVCVLADTVSTFVKFQLK